MQPSPHAMPNGREILDSFTFTSVPMSNTPGWHRFVALNTTLALEHPFIQFIRAVFHFLGYCGYNMAQGCYPCVGWYRADYDCDEHYFLGWWVPETSHLNLHYYHIYNPRYGRYDFVYNPPDMSYGHNRARYGIEDDITF